MRNRKTAQLILLLVTGYLLLVTQSNADEQVTITTYYPSPYGSYKQLEVYDSGASGTQTNFTQGLSNAGLVIATQYADNAYTPGVFWATKNDNPGKPKAGIYLRETNTGTRMYFGTSNNYATGITNDALVINELGSVAIGWTLNPTVIKSTMWNVNQLFGSQTGALPRTTAAFSTGGGTLLIFASGSGWSAGGQIGMGIQVDAVTKGYAKSFTNEASSHKAFVANPLVVAGIAAGLHTITLVSWNSTSTDVNDFFNVTVLELPWQ